VVSAKVAESVSEPQGVRILLGGVGVGFLRAPEVGVGVEFFARLQKPNWNIF